MAARAIRIGLFALLTLVLAALLFLQASGSVLAYREPSLAVNLAPFNGLAREQLAARYFMTGVREEADIVPSARAATPEARRAIAREPLAPKAYAVLAIAEADPAKKRALLSAASAVNRRDLLLQGLVLEDRVAQRDYPGTLEVLDRLLRVHPDQQASLFPVLAQALQNDAALPELSSLLDQGSEWREDFLAFAVRDPRSLANLAELRLARDEVDPEVDRRLVEGLARAGRIDLATQVYAAATGARRPSATGSAQGQPLAWTSEFAPIDWELADEAGFRAQQATGSPSLEINIRPGKGGVLARRLLPAPCGAFAVQLGHRLSPPAQARDMRLQLRCSGSAEPFADEPLRIGSRRYRFAAPPAGCSSVELALYGRAWSGRRALTGTIDPLVVYGG